MNFEQAPLSRPDIFSFWAGMPGDVHEHPSDADVLRRVRHGFQLECLPGPFKGRLKTAPVVLLALSPGYDERDLAHGASSEGQAYYVRSRTGECDLPSSTEHVGSSSWSARIIRQFALDYEEVRSKVSFLNIGPYKSRTFDDWHMLSALPSCRVALEWAQTILFPAAEQSERVVVCLRSARQWGLEPGYSYRGTLFAPICGRSGILNRGPERDRITAAIQAACRLANGG